MYLSDLLGSRIVDGDGRRAGRVRDMVIRLAGNGTGPVIGLVTRRHGQDLFISMERVARLAAGGVALRSASVAPEVFARREAEALLGRDVMDREVIDVAGTRLVRVAEVVLDKADGAWHVAGVTTGLSAVMRRLLPRALRNSRRAGQWLSWDNLELLACEVPGGRVAPDHRRLARLHPSDIARVADAVPARQASEIVASLDDDLAADTMEEMIDEKQADVVETLDPNRAAAILNRMAPDAADVLAESALAAAVLPLATGYSLTEAFGLERGVDKSLRAAAAFWGIFTGLIVLGALIGMFIPRDAVVQLLLVVQVVNGVLLPILLVFIIRLIGNREVMGEHTNGPICNALAWITVVAVGGLSLLMVLTTVLPAVGVHLVGP